MSLGRDFRRASGTSRFGVAFVVMSLLLSVLIMGNVESASAQVACAEGVQSGVRCEIEGPAPTQGADGLECLDGFELLGQRCVRYELADGADLSCDVGTLVLDQCVETGAAPEPTCPVSSMVFEAEGECYEIVPGAGGSMCPVDAELAPDGLSCRRPVEPLVETINTPGTCPDGFAVGTRGVETLCSRFEPATKSHPSCVPALGAEGDCYTVHAPVLSCSQGTLTGEVCTIVGDPPDNRPPTCPVHIAGVFVDGNFCYELVPPASDGTCPLPQVVDPGGQCRSAFPLQPGRLFCADGFGLFNITCARLIEPTVDSTCAPGLDSFGVCRVPDDGRQAGLHCLGAAEELQGSDCVTLVAVADSATSCPVGFAADAADGCAKSEAASQRPSDCPDGARGIVDGCYIVVAKGPQEAFTSYPGPFPIFPVTSAVSGPTSIDPTNSPGQCPAGSIDWLGGNCRKPVANARGAYYCASPHAWLVGRDCASLMPALAVDDATGCPTDFVLDAAECTRTVPATASDLGCPMYTLGSAGDCFVYVAPTDTQGTVCLEGELTEDGTKCFVDARVVPQDDTVECPDGFSSDESLGGLCARFEPASQADATCPEGARGVPGDCYILVARGPGGPATCEDPTAVLVGTTCVIEGDPPVPGPGTCPESAVVKLIEDECYRITPRPTIAINCDATSLGYNVAPYDLGAGSCEWESPDSGTATPPGFECPSVVLGETVLAGVHTPDVIDGVELIGLCSLSGSGFGPCPVGSVPVGDIQCGTDEPLLPGQPLCAAGYGLFNFSEPDGGSRQACLRFESPVRPEAECPADAPEDANGDCRKPVQDAPGAYFCEDAEAALNGTSCVFTAQPTVTPNPSLLVCDRGDRTVVDVDEVICILGDPVEQGLCPSFTEVQPDGRCTKSVGDVTGVYHCEDPTAILQFNQCLFTSGFSLTCTTAQAVAGNCGRPLQWVCPVDYSADDSLFGACTRFEPASENASGQSFCQDGAGLLVRESCVFVTEPADQCNGASAACPRSDEVSSCPPFADVFADGSLCYQQISLNGAACPAGSEPVQGTSLCRKVIPVEEQPLECAAGFNLTGDACLRFSEAIGVPDFDCADTGLGTAACNQVIGTVQEEPSDDLVSLRRTTVTYADCEGGAGMFKVTAANGKVVRSASLVEDPAGLYTARYFVPRAGDYQIDVTVDCLSGEASMRTKQLAFTAPQCEASGFGDVPERVYYEEAVAWAACVEVTLGTSDTTFSPNAFVTRAQMAAFLWRHAGEPSGAAPHGFVDVPSGVYYDEAVAWLKESGITTGTTDTTFSPNDVVSRAQMAAFVWRFAGRPASGSHTFVDVPSGTYYDEAVAWMSQNGITTGTSATTYSPFSLLTRGQAVTFLWRLADQPTT